MSPLDEAEYQKYHRTTGTFTTLRKLVEPGQSVELDVQDMSRHEPTTYPIKGETYCMRVRFTKDGVAYLLDLNGLHVIGQFTSVLYPNGLKGGLVPCRIRITRRTQRAKTQSEVHIELVGDQSITL